MQVRIILLFFLFCTSFHPNTSGPQRNDDHRIARAVRKAVVNADSSLLNSSVISSWREYLKIIALELPPSLQPLLLIRFDEDMKFRNRLKTLIAWETLDKVETEHYVYYFHWEHPPPPITLKIQDIHFQTITKLFQIDVKEKIPYRYDPTRTAPAVYPFHDLRAGVTSPQPFDLEKAALAIFYAIDSEPPSLIEPLSRIYGSYFQNQYTSDAYFDLCLRKIEETGYVSATLLYQDSNLEMSSDIDWYSAYAFVYELIKQFEPTRITAFLASVDCSSSAEDFNKSFSRIFEIEVADFEAQFSTRRTVGK